LYNDCLNLVYNVAADISGISSKRVIDLVCYIYRHT